MLDCLIKPKKERVQEITRVDEQTTKPRKYTIITCKDIYLSVENVYLATTRKDTNNLEGNEKHLSFFALERPKLDFLIFESPEDSLQHPETKLLELYKNGVLIKGKTLFKEGISKQDIYNRLPESNDQRHTIQKRYSERILFDYINLNK